MVMYKLHLDSSIKQYSSYLEKNTNGQIVISVLENLSIPIISQI